jgi:hypothetical protein
MDKFLDYQAHDINEFLPWWKKWPGKWPLLLVPLIEQFINKYRIPELTIQQVLQNYEMVVIQSAAYKAASPAKLLRGASSAKELKILDNIFIRGGIKPMHLHLGDKIYLLDSKQAQEFANQALAQCKEILNNVKQIGFEESAALAGMTQTITGK